MAVLGLALVAAPWVLSEYHLAQLLIAIYGIVGLGLITCPVIPA